MTTKQHDASPLQEPPTPPLPGQRALELLENLPHWGHLVTIVLHGGSVFEFKGPFPRGTVGSGYLNLDGPVPGFHGHIRLDAIHSIHFQERPHAGRTALALVFNTAKDGSIFKVFLGRDNAGEIFSDQRRRFRALQEYARAITSQPQLENTPLPLFGESL